MRIVTSVVQEPPLASVELKFWASLMGSAVLMLESGVRVNFQTIFARGGGRRGGSANFF